MFHCFRKQLFLNQPIWLHLNQKVTILNKYTWVFIKEQFLWESRESILIKSDYSQNIHLGLINRVIFAKITGKITSDVNLFINDTNHTIKRCTFNWPIHSHDPVADIKLQGSQLQSKGCSLNVEGRSMHDIKSMKLVIPSRFISCKQEVHFTKCG